jgi:hypothetical protein
MFSGKGKGLLIQRGRKLGNSHEISFSKILCDVDWGSYGRALNRNNRSAEELSVVQFRKAKFIPRNNNWKNSTSCGLCHFFFSAIDYGNC